MLRSRVSNLIKAIAPRLVSPFQTSIAPGVSSIEHGVSSISPRQTSIAHGVSSIEHGVSSISPAGLKGMLYQASVSARTSSISPLRKAGLNRLLYEVPVSARISSLSLLYKAGLKGRLSLSTSSGPEYDFAEREARNALLQSEHRRASLKFLIAELEFCEHKVSEALGEKHSSLIKEATDALNAELGRDMLFDEKTNLLGPHLWIYSALLRFPSAARSRFVNMGRKVASFQYQALMKWNRSAHLTDEECLLLAAKFITAILYVPIVAGGLQVARGIIFRNLLLGKA